MVIITDCGYRSAIAAIQMLNTLGEEIIGVTTDSIATPPAFHSRFLKNHFILSSEKEKYKNQLIELCSKHDRPVIIPMGVFTLNIISENIEVFAKVSDFCISEANVLSKLNDKSQAKQIALSTNITVPKIYTDKISFPAVIKPVCGEKFGLKASERYKIVYNEEELIDAKKHFSFSENVIEEYIDGVGVGVSIVMGKNKKPYSAFCHKRLSEYPATGGPSSSLITFKNDELIEKSIKLLQKADFSGIAMVEYKEKDGEYYFLEVNPRIWGSFGATTKAKSNFLESYIKAARNSEYTFFADYKIGKKVKFIPNIFASVFSYTKSKKIIKAFKTAIDALNPFVPTAIFSIKDPVPAILDILRKRR